MLRRCFDAHADEQKRACLRAPQKHTAPELERSDSGASGGTVFMRSFGVLLFIRDSPLQVK
jgi:hypothetical protein